MQEFHLSDSGVETRQLTAVRDQIKPASLLRSGRLPGTEPERGYDGEQLVAVATTVCCADDVSATSCRVTELSDCSRR